MLAFSRNMRNNCLMKNVADIIWWCAFFFALETRRKENLLMFEFTFNLF